jgi:hypothetical protein
VKSFFSLLTRKKKICIIQANCIAPQLLRFLMMSPGFSETYEGKIYTNFTKEPIPAADLSSCGLFIYQYLDEKWEDLASAVLTRKVGSRCRCVSIPSSFWRFLWPFWTADDERMKPSPGFPFGRHPYGDSSILRLLREGMPKAEIIRSYLELAVNHVVDLDAMLEEDLTRERERERDLDVKVSDYIAAGCRGERLLTSVNHPTNIVILNIANGVLEKIGYSPVPDRVLKRLDEFGDYHVPIHPAVIRHFGLGFVDEGFRYLMNGKMRTFREYIEDYIDYV